MECIQIICWNTACKRDSLFKTETNGKLENSYERKLLSGSICSCALPVGYIIGHCLSSSYKMYVVSVCVLFLDTTLQTTFSELSFLSFVINRDEKKNLGLRDGNNGWNTKPACIVILLLWKDISLIYGIAQAKHPSQSIPFSLIN